MTKNKKQSVTKTVRPVRPVAVPKRASKKDARCKHCGTKGHTVAQCRLKVDGERELKREAERRKLAIAAANRRLAAELRAPRTKVAFASPAVPAAKNRKPDAQQISMLGKAPKPTTKAAPLPAKKAMPWIVAQLSTGKIDSRHPNEASAMRRAEEISVRMQFVAIFDTWAYESTFGAEKGAPFIPVLCK